MAIAIPVFTTQLERSKESTDLANIRSAYAEAMTDVIATGSSASASGTIKQGDSTWHIDNTLTTRVDGTESSISLGNVNPGGSFTVNVTESGSVSVAFN